MKLYILIIAAFSGTIASAMIYHSRNLFELLSGLAIGIPLIIALYMEFDKDEK